MRVTYPGDSANPLHFRIRGVEAAKVLAVNGRGMSREVRSGDKLPAEFGEPVELWIYPKE